MAYFPDLSPYCYDDTPEDTLSVGFLDPAHRFTKGESSREFRERLRFLCEHPPRERISRGWHPCFFCYRYAGGAEMRVEHRGTTYMAPVLVTHYVDDHGYLPPREFIEAVMALPSPEQGEVTHPFNPLEPMDSAEKRWLRLEERVLNGFYLYQRIRLWFRRRRRP